MSLEMRKEWLKEGIRSIICGHKEINPEVIISYYSSGNIEEVIPELIEISLKKYCRKVW